MSINLESPAVPNEFLTSKELETGLDHIRDAPKDAGPLRLIVRRPNTGERELVQSAELDLREGLKGDNWLVRGSSKNSGRLGQSRSPTHLNEFSRHFAHCPN